MKTNPVSLTAFISLWRPGFFPRPAHVVDEAARRQISVRAFEFPPISTLPPTPHAHSSVHHRCYIGFKKSLEKAVAEKPQFVTFTRQYED